MLSDGEGDPQPRADPDHRQEDGGHRHRQRLERGRDIEQGDRRNPQDEVGRHRREDRPEPHHPGPRSRRRQSLCTHEHLPSGCPPAAAGRAHARDAQRHDYTAAQALSLPARAARSSPNARSMCSLAAVFSFFLRKQVLVDPFRVGRRFQRQMLDE